MLTLYGYRRCSTCRDAQKTLTANGAQVRFHDVVERPPSMDTIRGWAEEAGRPIIDFVNTRGTVYRERDLKNARFTEEEWLRELSADGRLLKRPILVTPAGEVFIGYDEGAYRRIALSHPA